MISQTETRGEVKRTPRKKVEPRATKVDDGAKMMPSMPSESVGEDLKAMGQAIGRPIRSIEVEVRRARPIVAQVNKQWFLGRLEDRNWSLRELARRMALDVSAVSLMMDGKRKMTAAEAGRIAHHLGVPVQDVLANAGVDVSGAKSNSVPLSGWVGPEGKVHLGRVQGPQTVSGPAEGSEELAALRVQGGALDGWVLFWRRQAPGVRPEAIGKLCVVVEAGEGGGEASMRVGWVRPGYEAGMWSLVAMDPGAGREGSGISQVRLESAVPVSWIRQ